MKRPYIVCHMMTSLDGRIDCAMTSQLPGIDDYYETLNELNVPTTLSGRVTAELEMAEPGTFEVTDDTSFGRVGFSKKADAPGYEIVVDTHGKLLWPNGGKTEKPYLIITCEQISKEYLHYLDGKNISWLACGNERVNLARASEILFDKFGVERMGIVGGAAINTAFLNDGLLDEISILVGAGIDARGEMPSVFDGREMSYPLTHLKLLDIKKFDSGAVWLRYGRI